MSVLPFTFKAASEDWEFEQIHRLNYATFVEEIPQHPPNPDQLLVDKFHQENTYLICLRGQRLIGMVAVRDRRPFSLDAKLDNLSSYLPDHGSLCEIRLLAVVKDCRTPRVFQGLMLKLANYVESHGYDLAVMSGTVRQAKLYRQLGFTPFGPLVGTGEALYQPMYLTLAAFSQLKTSTRTFAGDGASPASTATTVNFLPGPVTISEPVRQTLNNLPVSHRCADFMTAFAETKKKLCQLVNARYVEILSGSGTLANDVIAAQLSLLGQPGLVLSNGEFGERLIDHATRFKLQFREVHAQWGHTFDFDQIRRLLQAHGEIRWLWVVHCETSSGILNDLAMLQGIAAESDVLLCADCISSIGNVAVDLQRVHIAAGTSGKGLGSYPGLSLVFYNQEVKPAPKDLPRYLDLGFYASQDGVPFTISSNLFYAMRAALKRFTPERFDRIEALSLELKSKLTAIGLHLVGMEGPVSPAVITIALPESVRSESVGDRLQKGGYLVSYRSNYLLAHNWIQICLMGDCRRETFDPLVALLSRCCPASASN